MTMSKGCWRLLRMMSKECWWLLRVMSKECWWLLKTVSKGCCKMRSKIRECIEDLVTRE